MIKNRAELIDEESRVYQKRRKIILYIADFVLHNITPESLFKKNLLKHQLKNFDRIFIFGIGKASRGMINAILPLLSKKPNGIFLAHEGHPLPTFKGLKNTRKIITAAQSLRKNDLAMVLISGGGSAMLCAPVREITLQDKIQTTKLLLKSGATIQEINTVRKHLSQVKGGKLAELLSPAKVMAFVMSDVPGNDLSTIASGPLSPDPSTFLDALRIFKKYRIQAPARVVKYLKKGKKHPQLETPKPGAKYFKNVKIKIIADHFTVMEKAAEAGRKLGLRVHIIPELITGEAQKAARLITALKSKGTPHGDIWIAAGETTVQVKRKGFGGRNQEFVLAALTYLKPNQTLLSIGTDGIDGICPEPVAGAIADAQTTVLARSKNLAIDDFLKRNDSYTFFKQTNGLIKTGPTGTNLGDLILLLSAS